ncbi:hypothetical protein CDD81_5158 [Ophiocordyceps australis]|uniref:Uncharacterized protein n=1 Tax=Ophiocordyceps australis TaxID=1399860 RepID=A0A2C5XA47_9HYPO|nr:hypothetical protein CDD81_5158 [Ophiocordyceps australis]
MAAARSSSASVVSASSSPRSFYTANDSESKDSTAASSPLHGEACEFRHGRPLPRELKEHCQIYLEEQLYVCAINLFNSTLSAGLSRRPKTFKTGQDGGKGAVPVPPPSHLALLNTLLVHPLHTRRAEQGQQLLVPGLALDYLRNLLDVVGPLNADFRTAFQFDSNTRRPRRVGQVVHESDGDGSDDSCEAHSDRVRGKLSSESSLWNRGQDLWSTVGWALNTATLYPHRWRYWRTWLEFMLDAMEADWYEREVRDSQALDAKNEAPSRWRRESMIYMYMNQDGCSMKRIIKALFALGDDLSQAAFCQVFDKEHKTGHKSSRKRKRDAALDVENDKFGDYFDDESMSSSISEPPTPQKPQNSAKQVSYACSNPGLVESVGLRQRLFVLVSAATSALDRIAELDRLYEDFVTGIRVLPVPLFAHFVSQKPNRLPSEIQVTIIKELFHQLLPSKRRDAARVDAEAEANGSISMALLEHCYMDMPANTIGLEDNAKLSLVVESAVQLLWQGDVLAYSPGLQEAAERGIQAREAKVKKKRTGKMRADASDAVARDILTGSAQRIRLLMEALKASG